MTSVAVVAHARKRLGAGLPALRDALAAAGIDAPAWYEVPKSRKAPKAAQRALADGADRILVWGGDGTVQRCVDVLAGSGVTLGILPAGTANLFATNLGIPDDLEAAVDVALHGVTRELDVGVVNGERFVVMAGTGFDADMIDEADRGLKDRLGQVAYVWTGVRAAAAPARRTRIRVDGSAWFDGRASCVLVGNVGQVGVGIRAFTDARPDDAVLDLGVVTASTRWQWARVAASMVAGHAERSRYVQVTRAREVEVRLGHKATYELDGGTRAPTKRLRVHVEPRAISVAVPAA